MKLALALIFVLVATSIAEAKKKRRKGSLGRSLSLSDRDDFDHPACMEACDKTYAPAIPEYDACAFDCDCNVDYTWECCMSDYDDNEMCATYLDSDDNNADLLEFDATTWSFEGCMDDCDEGDDECKDDCDEKADQVAAFYECVEDCGSDEAC